jgi:hypothetical protein
MNHGFGWALAAAKVGGWMWCLALGQFLQRFTPLKKQIPNI